MPTQIELLKELSLHSDNWYEKYPWFSLAQLLNVSNKKGEDDFQPVAQTAAMFFNDIQRFHWLLYEQAFNKNKILNDLNVPISTEGMQITPQPFPKREHPQEIIAPSHLIAIAAIEEKDAIQTTETKFEENILIDDVVIHHNISESYKNDLSETIILHQENEVIEQSEKQSIQSKIYIQQPEEIKIAEPTIEQQLAEKVEVTGKADKKAQIENTGEEVGFAEDKDIAKNQQISTADSIENVTKAQENIKDVLDGGDAIGIAFEPYHTIDYFASQGIKVDIKADDKLGKQLKSFTSWLKSMKRLTTTEEGTTNVPIVEIKDKSLENIDVITEAMAAVLLKQGKKEQAVEIFRQLSLLHPEKSRYFAAQIGQIKN